MAKILIVDDNVDMLDTLEHLFIFYDFEVLRAENGQIGLEIAESEKPGLIILDALMPVMNGFEACHKLKTGPKTKDIPIIFLSANYTDREHREKGMEMGADDYLLKPFNAKELIAKTNALLHHKQLMSRLRSDNQLILKKQGRNIPGDDLLQKKVPELENNQITDSLTGLYNNDSFARRSEKELENAVKNQASLSLVLVDVDYFRKVNEAYGEKTGDYVLIRIANVILKNTRPSDIVFRLKNNKFAILLPETDEKTAFYEAEKVRSAILQTKYFDQDFAATSNRRQTPMHVTSSIGLAALGLVSPVAGDLNKQAENALNQAKKNGRNMTIRFSELA